VRESSECVVYDLAAVAARARWAGKEDLAGLDSLATSGTLRHLSKISISFLASLPQAGRIAVAGRAQQESEKVLEYTLQFKSYFLDAVECLLVTVPSRFKKADYESASPPAVPVPVAQPEPLPVHGV
jgi:hypothetical protein